MFRSLAVCENHLDEMVLALGLAQVSSDRRWKSIFGDLGKEKGKNETKGKGKGTKKYPSIPTVDSFDTNQIPPCPAFDRMSRRKEFGSSARILFLVDNLVSYRVDWRD